MRISESGNKLSTVAINRQAPDLHGERNVIANKPKSNDFEKEDVAISHAESSSATGSDGKGSGSGGGYSADCSSSDASSGGVVHKDDLKRLKMGQEDHNERKKNRATRQTEQVMCQKHGSSQVDFSFTHFSQEDDLEFKSTQGGMQTLGNLGPLPQLNGFRILHPMDPRIDLSTVCHIQMSPSSSLMGALNASPKDNPSIAKRSAGLGACSNQEDTVGIDQYMNLMEVVRPFFLTHGICLLQSPYTEEVSNRSLIMSTEEIGNERELWRNPAQGDATPDQSYETIVRTSLKDESNDIDDTSNLVLVQRKRNNDVEADLEDEGVDIELNGDSHWCSMASSSSRKQGNEQLDDFKAFGHNGRNGERSDFPGAKDEKAFDESIKNDAASHDGNRTGRRETSTDSSTSSSSNIEHGHRMGFEVPAEVSEYSTSLLGSSGIRSAHQLSTSGSGSAGNTGSGTASGSNQGGSSASGNDRGVSSLNGIGSSVSGIDVKGSSEETMENNGENHSGEGNSDATNSNNERQQGDAVIEGMNFQPRHAMHEARSRDAISQKSNLSLCKSTTYAAREQKLLDKRRKRMNMRREYEEKVQEEMNSSKGSRERDQNSLFKPGRPVTLDRVLGFSKTGRIVISATPPFLVVHTNAAYCRLSGIDSHIVVGKPISALLSIPDADTQAELKRTNQQPEEEGDEQELGESSRPEGQGSTQSIDAVGTGLSAADAASRARAATSEEDSIEQLIALHGFCRWNYINVHGKAHLLGEKVSVPKASLTTYERSRDEGSIVSNRTSTSECPHRCIYCSMSVSPIVSSPEAFATTAERDQESHLPQAKRRKHQQNDSTSVTETRHHQQHRRNFQHREICHNRKRHLITHYVIQLEPLENGTPQLASFESQSSASVPIEPQRLGMSKSEWRLCRVQNLKPSARGALTEAHGLDADDQMNSSEYSSQHEPMTAVG